MLLISETYADIDLRREACAHPIPPSIPSNRWTAVLYGIREQMRERGVAIEFDGEPGWFVCGLVH